MLTFSGRSGELPLVLLGDEGVAALAAFQQALGLAMMKAGLGRSVKWNFTPHMTLMYVNRTVKAQRVHSIRWTAREFTLVHSGYGQTQHNLLQRIPLRG
jgi:RNA 2',3'-cyclic 3'-phosphodiesterase